MQMVGIDVSAKTLSVRLSDVPEPLVFDNSPEGHQKLIRRLTKKGRRARVALEASGLYGLDLALALHRHPKSEVMVLNPRTVRDFARARLRRSKTDTVDAGVLREFVQRMPFQPWQPPAPERLELRALTRRLTDLTQLRTQEKNRLHAASVSNLLGAALRQDIAEHIAELDRRIEALQQHIRALIRQSPILQEDFRIITSAPGFADLSTQRLLGELCTLPPDMAGSQWVAHSGLDPRQEQSGTSLNKPGRISRQGNPHLRAILYLPALAAIRHDPHVRAFYQQLLARGKKPLQAVVAVMRKLLLCLHGMLRHRATFQGEKFRALTPQSP